MSREWFEMMSQIDLADLVKQWVRSLSRSQYAGELVIPEDDLPALSAAIRQDLFSARRSTSTKTALFVLAINCMYYYHDDSGFWIHFCQLLKVSDDSQTQSWLGDMIENQLLHFSFLDEARYGPFRYVSPLREQTGITRHEIPRFAGVLRNLSSKYGWPGIRALSRNSFNRLITADLQSGHLYRFLRDNSGWEFTIDVVRSISQYQRGILSLSDLMTLPGYRSGFFKKFFEELGRPPQEPGMTASKPSCPRLAFVPDFRQVMVLFNQEAVHNRAYEFFGQRVSRTPIACSEDMFKEQLWGKLRDSDSQWHDWAAFGWNPLRRPVALFHVDRGFIASPHQLIPGQYYCLASPDNAPPSEFHRCYYGLVDLPIGRLDYDAWLITIDPSIDLLWAGFNTDKVLQSEEFITWGTNQTRLEGAVDIEAVFIGSLPSVRIRSLSSFVSNTVALFVDDGIETRRLSVGPNDECITIEAPVPSRGRIWVEPISRRREFSGLDTLDELPFVVLPTCELHWPRGLFSPNDTPSVSLLSQNPDISLTLSDAVCVDDKDQELNVSPGIDVVQGRVECKAISVNVAKRIYRASVCKVHEDTIPYFGREDFDSNDELVVSGVSGTDVIVSLFDGVDHTKILALGTFNEAGDYRCSSMSFRDPIRHFRSPAGVFKVVHNGKAVRTGSVFIDVPQFLEFTSSGDLTEEPPWFNILPAGIALLLESLIAVRDEAQHQMVADSHVLCPEALLLYAKLIAICAAVYDETILTDWSGNDAELISELEGDNPGAAEGMRWFVQARSFCAGDGKAQSTAQELVQKYQDLTWIPPFPRWISAVENLLSHLRADVDVVPLIEEWREDVRRGYRSKYQSRIARQKFGKDLTDAWITYAAGNRKGAITKAKALIPVVESPVVDLAAILLRICWVRSAYFFAQPAIYFDSSNPKLCRANEVLKSVVCSPTDISTLEKDAMALLRSFTRALPLTEEDAALFEIILNEDASLQTSDINDWLVCYYRLCLSKENDGSGETHGIVRELDKLRGDIPASPDKRFVIEQLEKCL